jgi:hypothetical protein
LGWKRRKLEIIRFRNPHSIAIGMDNLLRKKKRKILTYSHKGLIVKDHIIGDLYQIWQKNPKLTKAKRLNKVSSSQIKS